MADRSEPASHGNLFLIAARVPTAGLTKTRLGATIGPERAALLYRAFLLDLARRFAPHPGVAPSYDLGWAYTPSNADFAAVLHEICGEPPPATVRFVPQHGADWAAGQTNLLRWGSDHGYARTVLVASDSPTLCPTTPAVAFAALVDHDVAVGRVHDGGYYLIGLRSFHDVLAGVPMSTDSAADRLVARAAALGLRTAELPPLFDVDVREDLDLLHAALAPDGAAAPATWVALHELDLVDRAGRRPAVAAGQRRSSAIDG